uniref:Cystathionine beta-synthase n=1 Tax=Dermatophagoides pteronyssinus TaxID=6956 RepID=A0A6P6YI19_DERPT|nr:cystathionine beta-synthase-like [Dermatophagoides pteronyssinus]
METVQSQSQCQFKMATKMKINDMDMDKNINPNSSSSEPIPGYIAPDKPMECKWSLNCDDASNPHCHRKYVTKPKIMDSILEHIGDTPLVRLDRIRKYFNIKCELLAKCEFFNPGGSVKDRIGWRMILDAERDGKLKPGDTIIEPTSGNTGIGLALASAIRGYHCIIVMPEKMSNEKVNVLRALGAEIIRTPNSARFDSPNSHICIAQKLQSQIKNSIILDQYRNPGNPLAHYDTTGFEILEQTDGKLDMIVMGAGTGGTMTGVARRIKEELPDCKIIGVDPVGSILAGPNQTNVTFYEVEGIGYDFIPTVMDRTIVDQWIKVDDRESLRLARLLIRLEGLLCGGSSGSALAGALRAAKHLNEQQRCVIVLPDGVRNYMTKFLDDDWLAERNIDLPVELQPKQSAKWFYNKTVKELIQGVNVKTIEETAKCLDAINIMKMNGFDQLPVVINNNNGNNQKQLIGMVTVGDIMLKLAAGTIKSLDCPITNVVQRQFPIMQSNESIGRLIHLLRRNPYVAIVVVSESTQQQPIRQMIEAIITHIDILNYLVKFDQSD